MVIEVGVLAAVSLASAIYRWKREQIRADRDKAIVELALSGTKPCDRGKIIESLAKTKQFSHVMLPGRTRRQIQPPPVDADDTP